MPRNVNLFFAIGLKPEQAVKYFESKGYTISWNWFDTWQEAHARAFTVAKAMRMDILQDIREIVDRAIRDGLTFEQFRQELEPRLKAKGWWGKQEILGPDGKKQVQLGSPYRLRTIYQVNTQVAYMSGRYKGMIDNVDDRPYWQYVQVERPTKRQEHALLHGKVFRWDDPIWKTHYPPNGWRCMCRVRALSKDRLKAKGLKVESSKGRLEKGFDRIAPNRLETVPVVRYRDPKTDRTMTPQPGWNYNPGEAAFQPNLEKYDFDVAQKYLEGAVTGPDFERFFSGKTKGVFPVAVLDQDYRKQIGAKSQVVQLSDETLQKNQLNHPELKISDYQRLPKIIANAKLIIQDGSKTLIFIKMNGRIYHAVIKSTRSGKTLFLTSFRFTNMKDVDRMKQRGRILKDELR